MTTVEVIIPLGLFDFHVLKNPGVEKKIQSSQLFFGEPQ
jgi:hypothetical protein